MCVSSVASANVPGIGRNCALDEEEDTLPEGIPSHEESVPTPSGVRWASRLLFQSTTQPNASAPSSAFHESALFGQDLLRAWSQLTSTVDSKDEAEAEVPKSSGISKPQGVPDELWRDITNIVEPKRGLDEEETVVENVPLPVAPKLVESKSLVVVSEATPPPTLQERGAMKDVPVFRRPLVRVLPGDHRVVVPLAELPPSLAARVAPHAHDALRAAVSVEEWVASSPASRARGAPRVPAAAPRTSHPKDIFTEEDVAKSQVRNSGHTRVVRLEPHTTHSRAHHSPPRELTEASATRARGKRSKAAAGIAVTATMLCTRFGIRQLRGRSLHFIGCRGGSRSSATEHAHSRRRVDPAADASRHGSSGNWTRLSCCVHPP